MDIIPIYHLALLALRCLFVFVTPLVWTSGAPVILVAAIFYRRAYITTVADLFRRLTRAWLRIGEEITSFRAIAEPCDEDGRQAPHRPKDELPPLFQALAGSIAFGLFVAIIVPLFLIAGRFFVGEHQAGAPYDEFGTITIGEEEGPLSLSALLVQSLRKSPRRFLIGAVIGFLSTGFIAYTTHSYRARRAKHEPTED